MRGRGYKPDPVGHRKTPFSRLLAMRGGDLTAPLPSTYLDLIDIKPKVFDQGPCGACVGHSASTAIQLRMRASADTLNWVPSPTDIYTLARCLDRVAGAPLEDSGTEPNQMVRAISEWGIRPMGPQPPDGRFSDADPATINEEPSLLNLERDATTVLLGAYAIASSGAQREQEIKYALFHGFPLTMAVDASPGSPIQNYGAGVIENMGEQLDHYVAGLAYRTVDGELQLGDLNSWSEGYGEQGMFWLGRTAIQQLGDIYAFDIRKVVSP